MRTTAAISGTGLFTPPDAISNEELVASFNEYVRRYNASHAAAIAPLRPTMPGCIRFLPFRQGRIDPPTSPPGLKGSLSTRP